MCQASRKRLRVICSCCSCCSVYSWSSGPIKRILCSYNVKVAQRPFLTLNHIFSKPKDPVPKEQKSDAIYSIPANDCNQEYIGQTKRQFGTRLKEHQKAVSL